MVDDSRQHMGPMPAGRPPMGPPPRPHADFTLFVGPVTCFYHCCGAGAESPATAALCPSDADIALGSVEQLAFEAIAAFVAEADETIASVLIVSACTSAFAGIDFAYVAARVQSELGIECLHFEHNRILLSLDGSRPRGPRPGGPRPGGPHPPGPRPGGPRPDGPRPGGSRPGGLRSGDEHFPTSGPRIRHEGGRQ